MLFFIVKILTFDNIWYIIKPHFDYCPIQKTEYFVNVRYKISDVNTYKKVSMECVYQEFYKQNFPKRNNCPIYKSADVILVNK